MTPKVSSNVTIEVMAENQHAAVTLAEIAHTGYNAREITELLPELDEDGEEKYGNVWAVESHCEACSKPILDDEEYTSTEEAVLCKECADQAKAEFQANLAAGKCGYCGQKERVEGEQFCKDCDPNA